MKMFTECNVQEYLVTISNKITYYILYIECNVQEYLVTISNKIIEDAVKAVREDCSLENIKWVRSLFWNVVFLDALASHVFKLKMNE